MSEKKHRVCPWWMGYFLLNPLRKLSENPKKILAPYIDDGMTVVDVGSAMGYFSLPAAKMVGKTGSVICIDMQERMLRTLERRVRRARLNDIVSFRTCDQKSLKISDLGGKVDLVLAIHVAHEVPDQSIFFKEISSILNENGKILFIEPKGHVSQGDFEKSLSLAQEAGLKVLERPGFNKGLSALLTLRDPCHCEE